MRKEFDLRKIIGPDVSFYQDDPGTPNGIDFVRMNKLADFVIIRAGQNLWTDRDFNKNWQAAKTAGLPRGSYWFYDSRADPKKQAELWVSLLKDDMGELPLFADLEEAYNGQFRGWENWKIFLEHLRSLVGQKEIGIYTAYYYWVNNAPNPFTQARDLEYFHRYPLWIANYGVTSPLVPKPWSADEWLLWQFTATGGGILYGVESAEIDLNYFNGDAQAFADRFNQPLPPDPTPPEPTDQKYIVNAGALYVREGPGTNYTAIGYLQRNDVVEAFDHNTDGTWLFVKRDSDGLMGWCSITYLVRVASPPEPEPPPLGNRYRVIASALYVREGPASTYRSNGFLVRDDIVDELESNADGSWKRIRRLRDQLTGWCSVRYLLLISTPSEPPEEPPTDPNARRHKVTALHLYVREGPGTSFKSVGYLSKNEIVIEVEANADRSWIKIRRADGLTGWVSARYLDLVLSPPPGGGTNIQYRITASRLYMREGPGTNYKTVGYVSQNDVVVALGANADQSWRQIRRNDGLIGWSSARYMTLVS
jgi:lysozyme